MLKLLLSPLFYSLLCNSGTFLETIKKYLSKKNLNPLKNKALRLYNLKYQKPSQNN
jgi:hypothetical protein